MTAEINEALRHNEIVGAAPDVLAAAPAPVVDSDVPPTAPDAASPSGIVVTSSQLPPVGGQKTRP
jgi:hypothetical protein